MNTVPTLLFIVPLLSAGCVVPATESQRVLPAPPPVVKAAEPTKFVETRYEVRTYRDSATPSLRHDPHAIFRRTRVPDTVEGTNLATRGTFPPTSIAPLPDSDELAAELALQKKLTAELRTVQAALVETEQKMKTQYAALVRQSEETLKLREHLESERNRLRSVAASDPSPVPAITAAQTNTEVKW
ncbi:MAG: hypothetical protein QM760_15955 [Nibricoccus sp.]